MQKTIVVTGGLAPWNSKVKDMMFYTYVLQSKKDGYLDIGYTNDLTQRPVQYASSIGGRAALHRAYFTGPALLSLVKIERLYEQG